MQTLSSSEDFVAQGNDAMRRKDWSEAVKIWTLMREQFPEHPRSYLDGARALKEQKEFKAADSLVLEGLEKFPEETELYIEYGDIATRQKNWAEAIKRWALMREKYPQNPRGYYSAATALREQGDFAASEALILEGLGKFPREKWLYFVYGTIAMCQKNWEEADRRWTLMREKCPQEPQGYIFGVKALKELKDFKAADALVLEGLEKFPKEIELYLEYGDIAMHLENWEEAVKRWALIREKYPQHPRGYYSAATALREQGDFETSEALILEGLKKFPQEQWLYFVYGTIATCQKNWEEAVKRWDLMREKCPQKPQGYISGVKALKELKDFKAADALVLEGLEKFPKETELYIEYGDTAMRQENWEEAARRWALMRERCPQHPRGYYSAATALREQDDFETSEAVILEGLKKFPQEQWLYFVYGTIAMRQKNWEEAAKRWALMREKFPEHLEGYVSGVKALKKNLELDAADALCLEGMKRFPQEDRFYTEYGDIAICQENWPEAIKRWASIREKYPQDPRGYINGALALKENREFDAADALVLQGLGRFPKEPSLYLEYIDIARRQENNREISRREAFMQRNIPKRSSKL